MLALMYFDIILSTDIIIIIIIIIINPFMDLTTKIRAVHKEPCNNNGGGDHKWLLYFYVCAVGNLKMLRQQPMISWNHSCYHHYLGRHAVSVSSTNNYGCSRRYLMCIITE
jgi:hypothetical protein